MDTNNCRTPKGIVILLTLLLLCVEIVSGDLINEREEDAGLNTLTQRIRERINEHVTEQAEYESFPYGDDDDSSESEDGDGLIQQHMQSSLQAQLLTKVSFDCWTRKEQNCEEQYCTWSNGACAISPAAYHLICSLYCEKGICIQLPVGTPPGSKVCPVKPGVIAGLCSTIKLEENCQQQENLCTWDSKQNTCVNAPTCCSKAQKYCVRRQRKQLLKQALAACDGFVNEKNICRFVKRSCL